ncbi:MAG: hypothetical protein R3Y28_06170 [Candidatus Gastranaerophilales bacterium]
MATDAISGVDSPKYVPVEAVSGNMSYMTGTSSRGLVDGGANRSTSPNPLTKNYVYSPVDIYERTANKVAVSDPETLTSFNGTGNIFSFPPTTDYISQANGQAEQKYTINPDTYVYEPVSLGENVHLFA